MSEEHVSQLVQQLEDALAQAKADRLDVGAPDGWEHVGWIDEYGHQWAKNLRNGSVTSDRPVFAPPAGRGRQQQEGQ